MDLRKLEVRLDRQDVRATVADAAGERELALTGEPFARVVVAAKPLFTELSQRTGVTVYAISIDAMKRRALAAGAEGAVRLQGQEYDGLAPRIAELARVALSELRTRRPDPAGTPSDAEFWGALYRDGGDGWELGRASPPLARFFAEHPPAGRRVLVVGCGRGHEARMLASLGAEVVAIDFAPEAIAGARLRAEAEKIKVDFRERDLFKLASDPERYPIVVEHCCFCAIDPARRDEYAEVVADVLEPGGALIGLFYAHGRAGGPPFSVTRDELDKCFSRHFDILQIETPPDSVVARQGQELLAVMRKG